MQKITGITKPWLSCGQVSPDILIIEVARRTQLSQRQVIQSILGKSIVIRNNESPFSVILVDDEGKAIDNRTQAKGKKALKIRLVNLGNNNVNMIAASPVEKEKANPGLEVIQSRTPDKDEEVIENYLETTQYWAGPEKQSVTSDILSIDDVLMGEIKMLADLETKFLSTVIGQYVEDVGTGKATPLTFLVEGNLANRRLMTTLRKWCTAVPSNQLVNYYRPDLGVTTKSDGKLKAFLCELNIITAGTPPAMLYRGAQESLLKKYGLLPAAEGSLDFFWEQCSTEPDPVLAIIGVTPIKPNQFLYERSHADMAGMLCEYGIPSKYVRLADLEIRNGRLILQGTNQPINLVYWRIPPFQATTLEELESPQGKLLWELYQKGSVKIWPSPCLPFMNNKALEAIVWDDRFQDITPAGLRDFVPKTEWISRESQLCQAILSGQRDWKNFVLKTAQGDGGVVIGFETPRQTFLELLKKKVVLPYETVIQEFIPPARLSFRTKGVTGQRCDKLYYLRIEPTIAVCQNKARVTDLFYTGRYETRKVGGSGNCIMGIITKKEKE